MKNICDFIQTVAQSKVEVHLCQLSHKFVDQFDVLLNVGQVIFMLHLFLDVRCW